jgi:nucleotide-binding universal stress UspA family protein
MIKSILAPLSGTDCDNAVLANSLRVFAGGPGHIDCLRLLPDPAELIAQAAQVDMGGWMIVSDTVTAIEKEAKQKTKTAQANLAAFCERENIATSERPGDAARVSVSWREEVGDEFDRISTLARSHDLVVLAGGADRSGRLPEEALGGIIIGGGRPVLLAPEGESTRSFDRIAIAWKDVPEAARAVTAAMPVLEKAREVHVFSANESGPRGAAEMESSDRIARCLRWHGLNVHGHFVIPAGRPPAEAVLQSAREVDASLLVMGAYGHSRMREFVFGGFTQRVLKGVELPVLLFH